MSDEEYERLRRFEDETIAYLMEETKKKPCTITVQEVNEKMRAVVEVQDRLAVPFLERMARKVAAQCRR